MTLSPDIHGVAAETEVSRHGIHDVQREDQEVSEEHDGSNTLLCGLLHVGHNGDELHLRAMSEAEDGQYSKKILVEDEGLQLGINAMRRRNCRFDWIRFATLAKERAFFKSSVVGLHCVRFDQTLRMFTDVICRLSKTAGVCGEGAVHHLRFKAYRCHPPQW